MGEVFDGNGAAPSARHDLGPAEALVAAKAQNVGGGTVGSEDAPIHGLIGIGSYVANGLATDEAGSSNGGAGGGSGGVGGGVHGTIIHCGFA